MTKTGEVISRCNDSYIHLHLLLSALHLLSRIDACGPYCFSNYYLTTVLHQHLGTHFLHTCQSGDSSLPGIMNLPSSVRLSLQIRLLQSVQQYVTLQITQENTQDNSFKSGLFYREVKNYNYIHLIL